MTQTLTFINLKENLRNKSGFSRKAYQIIVQGTTITRRWGPVSSIRRKTYWEGKPREMVDYCGSRFEAERTLQFHIQQPGEVPVGRI
jgi:hypothetical protein